MTILVGHPSPSVLNGMACALESGLGLEVVQACTAAECAQRVAQQQPAIAVLDVDLASGQELELCKETVGQGVRVLMITRSSARNHLDLLEHGAHGIVVSDDGLDGLLTAVRTVLDGHSYLPPHLLGTVLHDLIKKHRAQETAATVIASLSPREREVLDLLGEGADTREIARRLFISPHTAKTHVTRVLGKLKVHSRSDAAALVLSLDAPPLTLEASDAR